MIASRVFIIACLLLTGRALPVGELLNKDCSEQAVPQGEGSCAWNAVQVQAHRVQGTEGKETPRSSLTKYGLQVIDKHAEGQEPQGVDHTFKALLQGNRTKIVITSTVVLSALGAAAAGMVADHTIGVAFDHLKGGTEFKDAYGEYGLPLTVGVINNSPNPVRYVGYELRDGTAWGVPAQNTTLAPGAMIEWFLYTMTTGVEATISLVDTTNANKSWSIAAANYRWGNLFTGCDRLRVKVTPGLDMSRPLDGMCHSVSGPGISVQGGYETAISLDST
jgi:hypothetical protein